MNRCLPVWMVGMLMCACATTPAHAAGKLSVHDATIDLSAGATQAASGYATLGNIGDSPVRILSVQSDAFRAISLLQDVAERGVTHSREMVDLRIAPGQTLALQAGAIWLSLMDPRHAIVPGDEIHMVFLLGDGTRVPAIFDVAADSGAR